MMANSSHWSVESLETALAIGSDGIIARPLDVIGLIPLAAQDNSLRRQLLWRRLFLEAPLPYWSIVTWTRKLAASDVPAIIAATVSEGWNCTAPDAKPDPQQILKEVVDRFREFNPYLYPCGTLQDDEDSPQLQKFLLGRELARSYVNETATGVSGAISRQQLLFTQQSTWLEWIEPNVKAGYSVEAVCEATALALDHIVSRDVTPGVNGVGRAHILLEQLNVSNNPAMGVVTASIWPLDDRHSHLSGIVVPDLRENGVLVIAKDFLVGVREAWRYVRAMTPSMVPAMLCFSIRPSSASVVQQLSGRSAELSILAAIESAVHGRVLRPDVAASATITLHSSTGALNDPETGPASFEEKKYVAAVSNRLSSVIVHLDTARQWRHANPSAMQGQQPGAPDVVASEFYRRDALPGLETRSQWKLAYQVPGKITLAFIAFATLVWQLYKMSASPSGAAAIDPQVNWPLVLPALVGSEMLTLVMSLAIIQQCQRSIKRSLDSARASWLALAVCSVIVLLAQFVPIGARYEGLIDTPLYSVLFGEPQVTAQQVIAEGGGGLLALHAATQSLGFIAIQFGISAFAIRLIQTRAHSEPIYEDRCELIKKDWYFSLSLIVYFFGLVSVFCLLRNAMWYYYLAALPHVTLIEKPSPFWAMFAPLIGVTVVLVFSVLAVWLYVLNSYLVKVVSSAQGRSGYTSGDVVASLPRLARWLYRARPGD